MRAESRTKRILKAALEELEGKYEIEILDVDELGFQPLSRDIFNKRCSGEVDEKAIVTATKVAAADRIVVAAPFWDMNFPAALKAFFENLSLYNITFADNGKTCFGLCKCKHLLYITTRGMDIADGDYREQGSTYLKALSSLWSLGEVTTVSAHNLDYSTAEEVERKVEDAILRVREICKTF